MHTNTKQPGLMIRLWRDEYGALGAGDYILMVTIICIGSVAGLATVRDAVLQDMGDVGAAMECISQSYTVNATTANGVVLDYGYQDTFLVSDPEREAPLGIEIGGAPSGGETD